MELKRLSERVWFFPFEEERDRPNLGYVRGDNWSLAVDAGHSARHTAELYRALEKEGLPLPRLTVLTHWHWDHCFGMHAVNGLCIANKLTNQHLVDFKERVEKKGVEEFFGLHESIRREYAEDKSVVITTPDILFSGELLLDAGNCPIRLLQSEAPHTDDSTLIYVVNEKVLFVGDANCSEFMTGEKDVKLCRKLADTVSSLEPDICLEGHWVPVDRQDLMGDIMQFGF